MAIICLGPQLLEASCGRPDEELKKRATSIFVLFGLSSRRDCRVSPRPQDLAGAGLVSVALPPKKLADPPRFVAEIRTINLGCKIYGRWVFPTTLPCEARTFLPRQNHGRERSPERILSRIKKTYAVAVAFFSAGAAPSNSFNWVFEKLAQTRSGYFCAIC